MAGLSTYDWKQLLSTKYLVVDIYKTGFKQKTRLRD